MRGRKSLLIGNSPTCLSMGFKGQRRFTEPVSILRYFLAFEKCGAAGWSLFGTPQRAPQGVLGDGVGSMNRHRPLKPHWAE